MVCIHLESQQEEKDNPVLKHLRAVSPLPTHICGDLCRAVLLPLHCPYIVMM